MPIFKGNILASRTFEKLVLGPHAASGKQAVFQRTEDKVLTICGNALFGLPSQPNYVLLAVLEPIYFLIVNGLTNKLWEIKFKSL